MDGEPHHGRGEDGTHDAVAHAPPEARQPQGEHDTDYLSDTIEGRDADLFAARSPDA